MKAIKLVIGSMPMLLLAACMEAEPEATLDPITRAISGKTLAANGNEITMGADGSLDGILSGGTAVKGAWEVRDGDLCRTLVAPANLVGTECQKAVLGDGVITITGLGDRDVTWTIN